MVAGWLRQEGLQTVLHLTPRNATQNDSQISEHIQEFLFLPTVQPSPLPELCFLRCLSHETLFTHIFFTLQLKRPRLREAFSSIPLSHYPVWLSSEPQAPLLERQALRSPVLLTVITVSGPQQMLRKHLLTEPTQGEHGTRGPLGSSHVMLVVLEPFPWPPLPVSQVAGSDAKACAAVSPGLRSLKF